MKKVLLTALVVSVCSIASLKAQLYAYTNNLSGVPATTAAHTTATSLSQVNGAFPASGCPTGFNSNKFTTMTTFSSSRSAIEFTVTPDVGYQLNVTYISVDARISTNGPAKWRIAYSLNGGATWIDNGSDFNVTPNGCNSMTNLLFDVADFSTHDALKIRVYGFASLNKVSGIGTVKNFVLAGSVAFADEDGDGYTSDVDCNDADIAINPGVAEICNGIDDNCSGVADEGVTTTYFADTDGDTFGNSENSTQACSLPAGYVTDNTDCNDENAAINPEGIEYCNSIDDDCNGTVDDGLSFITYYADADGDGFGDAATSSTTCDGAPAGFILDNSDCDDAQFLYADIDGDGFGSGSPVACGIADNSDCYPSDITYEDLDGDGFGSAVQVACGVTNNIDCDDAALLYQDIDGDGFGSGSPVACGIADNSDCYPSDITYADTDGDGYGAGSPVACGVITNTDCDPSNAAISPGASEICNTFDDNCNGVSDEGVQTIFYADGDNDGFGNASVFVAACSAPAGYVLNGTDCNDAVNTVNPSASEICNEIDDDCDGSTDEGTAVSVISPAGSISICQSSSVTLNVSTCAGCTYQWFRNGNLLGGATSTSFVVTSAGSYTANVLIPAGCSATSSATSITLLSLPNATISAPLGTWICTGAKLKAVNNVNYTYQWNLGGTAIAGATSYYIQPTVPGSYTCTVTNNNGCVKVSTPIAITNCGKEGEINAQQEEMVIYPNPSNGNFTVELTCNSTEQIATVHVLNIVGEEILTSMVPVNNGEISSEVAIDHEISGGVYFVKVSVGEKEFTKQLIIQK